MLRWSAAELATNSKLARTTIVRAELSDGVPGITQANLYAIKGALEAAGVVFSPEGYVGLAQNYEGS